MEGEGEEVVSSQLGTRVTVEARTCWAFLAGAKAMEEMLLEAESDGGNAPRVPTHLESGPPIAPTPAGSQ